MREVVNLAERLAETRSPVIIQGETGTGKEVFARLLHERGARRTKHMACLNCGAIPSGLVESTLFGHERGAFTGALQSTRGVFEYAHEGTVFLDEIGELPAGAQAALLRVLETGTFCRVGSLQEITVNVRVVAATHRDLRAMVAERRFREDLYYRLSTFTLHIPPLRERDDEVEPLSYHFMRLASQANQRTVERIESTALAELRAYPWPGNVRELRNAIEHAVVVAHERTIRNTDLPQWLRQGPIVRSGDRGSPSRPTTSLAIPSAGSMPTLLESDRTGALPALGRARRMHEYETQLIVEALNESGWSCVKAAKALGTPRRTLTRRMRVLGIRKPDR
jgi:DNA-binding NtrC family response regulator